MLACACHVARRGDGPAHSIHEHVVLCHRPRPRRPAGGRMGGVFPPQEAHSCPPVKRRSCPSVIPWAPGLACGLERPNLNSTIGFACDGIPGLAVQVVERLWGAPMSLPASQYRKATGATSPSPSPSAQPARKRRGAVAESLFPSRWTAPYPSRPPRPGR